MSIVEFVEFTCCILQLSRHRETHNNYWLIRVSGKQVKQCSRNIWRRWALSVALEKHYLVASAGDAAQPSAKGDKWHQSAEQVDRACHDKSLCRCFDSCLHHLAASRTSDKSCRGIWCTVGPTLVSQVQGCEKEMGQLLPGHSPRVLRLTLGKPIGSVILHTVIAILLIHARASHSVCPFRSQVCPVYFILQR